MRIKRTRNTDTHIPELHKVDELLTQVARDLHLPYSMVKDVVDSQFKFTWKFLQTATHPLLRLPYLGKFVAEPGYIYWRVKMIISSYRRYEPTEKDKELLNKVFKLRIPARAYRLQRSYKLRFGKWHYKHNEEDE